MSAVAVAVEAAAAAATTAAAPPDATDLIWDQPPVDLPRWGRLQYLATVPLMLKAEQASRSAPNPAHVPANMWGYNPDTHVASVSAVPDTVITHLMGVAKSQNTRDVCVSTLIVDLRRHFPGYTRHDYLDHHDKIRMHLLSVWRTHGGGAVDMPVPSIIYAYRTLQSWTVTLNFIMRNGLDYNIQTLRKLGPDITALLIGPPPPLLEDEAQQQQQQQQLDDAPVKQEQQESDVIVLSSDDEDPPHTGEHQDGSHQEEDPHRAAGDDIPAAGGVYVSTGLPVTLVHIFQAFLPPSGRDVTWDTNNMICVKNGSRIVNIKGLVVTTPDLLITAVRAATRILCMRLSEGAEVMFEPRAAADALPPAAQPFVGDPVWDVTVTCNSDHDDGLHHLDLEWIRHCAITLPPGRRIRVRVTGDGSM